MRKRVFRSNSIILAVLAAGFVFGAALCFTQPQQQMKSSRKDSLRLFLKDYLKGGYGGPDATTRYSSAFVDLKDDGTQEVIVYVTGRTWCGSGGCRMLVLEPKGASYKAISQTTVTRLPIRVLAIKSNGWHDIGVWVQGGGIIQGYEADLPFSGGTYPHNPSTPPARRLEEKVAGEVVVPKTAVGEPLF